MHPLVIAVFLAAQSAALVRTIYFECSPTQHDDNRQLASGLKLPDCWQSSENVCAQRVSQRDITDAPGYEQQESGHDEGEPRAVDLRDDAMEDPGRDSASVLSCGWQSTGEIGPINPRDV